MNTRILLGSFFMIVSFCLRAEEPIEVADNTLKIGAIGEELFYYGFAEGDEIIFSFEVVKGKHLKEIEILEYDGSSKFMDYKTKKIKDKHIKITKPGIYVIRLANSSLGKRICKFNIKRIPATEETKNFNTTVYWKMEFDTTFYTVQERYLIGKDTTVHNLTDRVEKVHSQLNLNGSRNTFNFTLPVNCVGWSYYVGVDQSGQVAYENATRELAENAGPIVNRIPGYGPLASLTLGGASYIAVLQRGEDIDYYIVDGTNVSLFRSGDAFYYKKKGKVINDYSRMTLPLKGTLYFCLSNDNAVGGVSVTVKITAVCVKENWGTRPLEKYKVKSREVAYLK